jgi:fido (protein-threonine AMPylation protein)
MSRYDGVDTYVIPGTEVLRNQADIADQKALDAFEADATALRMLEMLQQPIPGNFDLAHFMGEINAAHPFREGNGRVQRLFCAQLAEQAGYFIDFESVSQDEMYGVMAASFAGDGVPLAQLLERISAVIADT